ncbi:hypothetical protein V866_003101 [Kwoniella sp. B9012]
MPEIAPSNASQSNPAQSDTQPTHRTLIGRCRFLPDDRSSYFTLLDALTADEGPDVNLGPKNHNGIWSGGNTLISVRDETVTASDGTDTTVKSYQGLSWDTKHVRGEMYGRSKDGHNIFMGRTEKSIRIISKKTLLADSDFAQGYHWVKSKGLEEVIETLDDYERYNLNKALSRPSEWNAFYNSTVEGGIEYEPARKEPVGLHGLIVGYFQAVQETEIKDEAIASGSKRNRERVRQVDEIDLDYEIIEN